jgi:hypothetical protein
MTVVESATDFARYYLPTCLNGTSEIESVTPFFVMLRDGDNEHDNLQEQSSIYLVEFMAQYEEVEGSQRETMDSNNIHLSCTRFMVIPAFLMASSYDWLVLTNIVLAKVARIPLPCPQQRSNRLVSRVTG